MNNLLLAIDKNVLSSSSLELIPCRWGKKKTLCIFFTIIYTETH